MQEQIAHYESKLRFEIDSADLFDALERGERIVVVDARKPEGYAAEHIPGAINLPHPELTAQTTAHLDKSVLYVSYCDGIGCNASTHGALKLASLGFQVKELMGGLDWWKRDGFATEGSHALPTGTKIRCAC